MANAIGKDDRFPNYGRAEYLATAPDLLLIENELGGTRAMHAASKSYIRKWKDEQVAVYDYRRTCETFFEGLGRTLSAGIGMLFAKPPAIVWNGGEGEMEADFANIDAAGTAGHVFVKRFAQAALRDGLSLILVDHPSPPEGVTVHAGNERDLNLRPVWSIYPRASIINWYAEKINNVLTPTLIVAYEPQAKRKGTYGTEVKHLYRVFRLDKVAREQASTEPDVYAASWQLWEMRNSGTEMEDFVLVNNGVFRNRAGQIASLLPISIAYTGDTDAPMQAKIPLLGVAWANLSHWQLSSDLRFNTVVAGFAQPVVIGELATSATPGGVQPKGIGLGPLVMVLLKEGGDFKWAEITGASLAGLAALVLEKLRQMGALGVSFLMSDTRAAETAEAKRLDAAAENATLATAAQAIEDAVNMAYQWDGWYRGIPKEQVPVMTLSRDYENVALDSPVMLAYVKAVSDAGMPVRILLQAFQQGGRIPADEDLDALEAEMLAGAAALADAKAEEGAAEDTSEGDEDG